MISLPERPLIGADKRNQLEKLVRVTRDQPPPDLAAIILDEFAIDLSTSYAGTRIPHPFGKASGQLSCTIPQVREDADAGIAFVVLKTVIAETASGDRSMAAWANPETKMRVEQRVAISGRTGWTVTWKGRGWPGSLDEYCGFFDRAMHIAGEEKLLVVPSVKYHLPDLGESHRAAEYEFTTKALEAVWKQHETTPLILEKDLSPTLAGDAKARDQNAVLHWLRYLPTWVRDVTDVRLGIKVMNAMYDDKFQLDMLRSLCVETTRPDFLVVFNRMFDRDTQVAYGGWDLSDRNLRILKRANEQGIALGPLSGTGNICSGRVMVEYALCGCENGQVHTFFQVPRDEFLASGASRTRCALYTLCLDPTIGLVPWLWTMHELGHLEPRNGCLHFRDIVGRGLQ